MFIWLYMAIKTTSNGVNNKNIMKIFFISFLLTSCFLLLALFILSNICYNLILKRKNDLVTAPSVFFAKHNSREVYIRSFDNLLLHSIITENTDRSKWVIVCHGYKSNPIRMEKYADEFYQKGFCILALSARGHFKSGGEYIGMGWHERLDIINWCSYLSGLYPDCRIILFGLSMGGAAVMMASGESLPSNVSAVIEDCGYTSIRAEFAHQMKQRYHLPAFPILNFFALTAKGKTGYNFLRDGMAEQQLKKAKLPMLFIHGGDDDFVPYYMLKTCYNSAGCIKEMLTVPNAAHTEAADVNPRLYWQTVFDFINSNTEINL